MGYSKKLKASLERQIRDQVRLDIQADKEIETLCEKYHLWVDKKNKENKKPTTIIAEGDSWFRYPIGKAVIFCLEQDLKIKILNLAAPGDEVREMLSLKQRKLLIRELKKGPTEKQKFDFFLFSGGGNDLLGSDRFHKWLHPYRKWMKPKDILNWKTLEKAFDLLEFGYKEIINIRDVYSPKTRLLLHSYDFAIPNGRGVCGKGPWLKPGLDMRAVPVKMHKKVVKLFLQNFDSLLDRIAEQNKRVNIVQTQGTLNDDDWANEIHPKNRGFRKISNLFMSDIEGLGNPDSKKKGKRAA